MMVEEEALPGVESTDRLHILIAEREVKDVEILLHALFVGALRDDYDVILQEVAKADLGNTLTIPGPYGGEDRVGEESVAAFCHRAPCHVGAAEFLLEASELLLLIEDMGLHLVDHRRYLHI